MGDKDEFDGKTPEGSWEETSDEAEFDGSTTPVGSAYEDGPALAWETTDELIAAVFAFLAWESLDRVEL